MREQILSHSLDSSAIWDIEAAEKPYASQFKIFGKIDKNFKIKSCDLVFAFYADYTLSTEALGNDFLINFEIRGTF